MPRSTVGLRWFAGALILILSTMSARAEDPVVRVGVLKFGTVNWLMEAVSSNGLDQAEGIRLETVALAGKAATSIAFQAGDVDMIVTDWIWAMRQNTKNKTLRYSPYSTALGALVAGENGGDLCDFKDRTLGIVGGALDKSWLVLQALADKKCGFDIAAENEVLFGAPPLMSRQLQDGAIQAVSTYWKFVAQLEAKGFAPVVRIDHALSELGISPAPPLIGFVWDEERSDAKAVQGLIAAIRNAGALLAKDDEAWERLRPVMRAKTEAEFIALRDAYRAGIPVPWSEADTASSRKLYDLLTERAGAAFTDQAGPFDPSVFPAL